MADDDRVGPALVAADGIDGGAQQMTPRQDAGCAMPHSRARARRPVAHLLAVTLLGLVAAGLGGVGCSSGGSSGFYHRVQPGENLYRIGLRYGVSPGVLVKANRIDDVTEVREGTRLWVPARAAKGVGGKAHPVSARAARIPSNATEARRLARLDARRTAKLTFAWPVRGRLTSRFGQRDGRPHEGLDLASRPGAPIHAAEAGRVIHSGRLGDYGKVVIVKHAGHYRSVYAHASKLLVRRGSFVEKGDRIALVGATGRATGPHLHFEIRRRESPRDPMLYLP
jgi:murein DD-endopeptidase MepM/ murein hydrolase activator NlpD